MRKFDHREIKYYVGFGISSVVLGGLVIKNVREYRRQRLFKKWVKIVRFDENEKNKKALECLSKYMKSDQLKRTIQNHTRETYINNISR